jgi:D-alanyl-D-alanine carboxypeptidase
LLAVVYFHGGKFFIIKDKINQTVSNEKTEEIKKPLPPKTTLYGTIKNNLQPFPKLTTNYFLAFYVEDDSETGKKIGRKLVEGDSQSAVPIASLTKLMTIGVVLNIFKDNLVSATSADIAVATVTEKSFSELEWRQRYKKGDVIQIPELIKSMLVESDNVAARTICTDGNLNMIDRMNSLVHYIGATSSVFYNCTGLENENDGINLASARDVVLFMRYLLENFPDVLDITLSTTTPIYKLDGEIHHTAYSTLSDLDRNFPFQLMAGKTGTENLAKENLILAFKAPHGTIYVVVLGSDDRFSDIKKIVNYLDGSYEWGFL